MSKLKEIAEQLVNLTAEEAKVLAQILKDEHGISVAETQTILVDNNINPVEKEEKTQFDVILKSAGQTKLIVIKLVKELTSLGLKESKELVDAAPKPIREKISKAEAEMLKKQLEEVGAEIEIR